MTRIFVRAGGDPQRGSTAQAEAAGWRVAADATLYYQADLRARVGGVAVLPADLIAEAIAKSPQCAPDWIEGDYAFVAWKPDSGETIAARDFAGKRPLFYAVVPDGLLLASDPAALLAEPGVDRRLDIARIAAVAAGLWCHGGTTAYAGIHELPAGSILRWRPGQQPSVSRFWTPPTEIATRRAALDGAADELRGLLEAAVRERVAHDGITAVSLSGGWDSTAVYGTAKAIGVEVHPVSISYPEGDPGREDEYIRDVTSHWGAAPDFIDIAEIPLARDWQAEAAARALPFAHAYEHWNRAIVARARARGATVLLDGVGGDQLFQCGDIYLADLLRSGQWWEAATQIRGSDGRLDWSRLRTWGLQPLLPRWWRARRAAADGRVFTEDYLERLPPRWFHHVALREHRVLERERGARPPHRVRSAVLAEAHAYLEFGFFPRIFALLGGFAADAGLELRSPLLDQRVVRFALQRPWSDRVDRGETKRLLRRAMQGRLPAHVLAPRPQRTGTTIGYFLRTLRADAWPVAQAQLRSMRLADLGLVDPVEYERAWQHLLQHDDGELAARLFFSFATELWLRAQHP